jgi:FkbM family methyltransferase
MDVLVRGRETLNRFKRLIRYNRDWPKYLSLRRDHGPVRTVEFRLRNGQLIKVSSDARFTLNELYLDHVYDVPGIDWSQCKQVLDLGANVGLFALYVASRNRDATIHCFEPEAKNFKMLLENASHNSKARIKAYDKAVSDSCRSAKLQFHGSAGHALSDQGSVSVECVDLAKVFELTGVERFDFCKIDIEGSEKELLHSATEDQIRRMGTISMEWHWPTSQMHEAAERLGAMGLRTECSVRDGKVRYLKAWQPTL